MGWTYPVVPLSRAMGIKLIQPLSCAADHCFISVGHLLPLPATSPWLLTALFPSSLSFMIFPMGLGKATNAPAEPHPALPRGSTL